MFNMAEDCCDASSFFAVYLIIVFSAFAHLSVPKYYLLKVCQYLSQTLVSVEVPTFRVVKVMYVSH